MQQQQEESPVVIVNDDNDTNNYSNNNNDNNNDNNKNSNTTSVGNGSSVSIAATTAKTKTFNLKGVKVQHRGELSSLNVHHHHHHHHCHHNNDHHRNDDSCSYSSSSDEEERTNGERLFMDPKSNVPLGVGEDHFILLPHHHDRVNHFALDIGGSLVKMVYYEAEGTEHRFRSVAPKSPIPVHERVLEEELGRLFDNQVKLAGQEEEKDKTDDNNVARTRTASASSLLATTPLSAHRRGARICFARFKTADIEDCLSFIEDLTTQYGRCDTVHATGGGAFKFSKLLQKRLGIRIRKLDEMESLIGGLNFLLKNIHDETFVYKQKQQQRFEKKTPHSWMNCEKQYISFKGKSDEELYPYLLVNIGSGVSIVRVFGDHQYERVSGSSVGGGTFWGLGALLTDCSSFEELLDMTLKGDNRQVDMLVGDIYGRDYGKIGLSSDTIASTFGKIAMKKSEEPSWKPTGPDVAKSLLFMMCNNIGQIAYLNAMRYGLKRIYFAGYFIRDHPITMYSISYAIDYWSRGEMQAFFLKHEGYLGAIGSFFNSSEHNFIVDDEVANANNNNNNNRTDGISTTDTTSSSNSNSTCKTDSNTTVV